MKFIVIGSGFSGAVIARELASRLGASVLVLDERPHIAGNCFTERDTATGVMLHRYGPHIFNTNDQRVWDYVNSHGIFRPFVNRVKASTPVGVFSLPINLHTINQFFGKAFTPSEAEKWVRSLGDDSIKDPQNFEEQALRFLGSELYQTFFYGYTKKQWGCEPRELPASILKRLPIRFNYDDNYYEKRYQGIPEKGYTEIVQQILDHPGIEVRLGERFEPERFGTQLSTYSHVFYTGPIDAFFGHSLGRLSYRTVTFERIETTGDYQGNAVINYPDMSVPYTRIHEHKHFTPWETHEKTVAFKEFSKETEPPDVPYYPRRLAEDKALLLEYRALAESLPTAGFPTPVSFLGRLATYRYMDMERVIAEALEFADHFTSTLHKNLPRTVFPNHEA